jgi:hypothetical protein
MKTNSMPIHFASIAAFVMTMTGYSMSPQGHGSGAHESAETPMA